MGKFTNKDTEREGLLKSDEEHTCMMCKESTRYIEICSEGCFCSKECMDKFYDIVTQHEQLGKLE